MKALILFALLVVIAFGGACGSNRADPLGVDDGSSLSGQNLANAAVTEATSIEFYMLIVVQLFDAHLKGITTLSNYSGSGTTVNFLGAYGGNALVSSASQDLLADLSIQFKNFSNTGRLFFAGTIDYHTDYRVITGGETVMNGLWLDGTLNFAGDYAGSIEFQNMRVGLDASGRPVDLVERANNPQRNLPLDGGILITSGGATIRTNPNEVDHPIGN